MEERDALPLQDQQPFLFWVKQTTNDETLGVRFPEVPLFVCLFFTTGLNAGLISNGLLVGTEQRIFDHVSISSIDVTIGLEEAKDTEVIVTRIAKQEY